MIKKIYRSSGEKTLYITVTTRKGNYVPAYFGKFTFWESKEHYDRGDCEGAVTYKGVYLGYIKLNLEEAINSSVDAIMKWAGYKI